MTKAEMTGALFFSKEQPEISGYLVINGEHFEIAGWRPSPIRADIKARRIKPESDDDDRSGPSARECDPA
jgi:hypothetical protein